MQDKNTLPEIIPLDVLSHPDFQASIQNLNQLIKIVIASDKLSKQPEHFSPEIPSLTFNEDFPIYEIEGIPISIESSDMDCFLRELLQQNLNRIIFEINRYISIENSHV